MYRLKYTRAILDSIHSGELAKAEYETYETFNLHVPKSCTGVPSELLNPAKSWHGATEFKEEVTKLGGLFVENFKKYEDEATEEVVKAGKSSNLLLYGWVDARWCADSSLQDHRFEICVCDLNFAFAKQISIPCVIRYLVYLLRRSNNPGC